MKTKTAYRPKNIPAVEPSNIPEEPIQPSESVRIEFNTDKAEPAVAVVSADAQPDEATQTLLKQIADLKKSETLQREFAQHVAAQRAAQAAPTLPADPEARIALWVEQGLSVDDAAFMTDHIELAAEPALTRVASDEAAQHHERDTDAHRAATLEAFHRLQGRQVQAQPAAADPAGFFRPRPAPSQEPSGPASYVSAPVSRQAPSTGYRETNPRQVKLSPAEQQIAAASGISDVQYAANKLRMLRERAAGERD